MTLKPTKLFVLYDSRAQFNVDRASVITTAYSETEAKRFDKNPKDIWFEYDVERDYESGGTKTSNGRPRYDIGRR